MAKLKNKYVFSAFLTLTTLSFVGCEPPSGVKVTHEEAAADVQYVAGSEEEKAALEAEKLADEIRAAENTATQWEYNETHDDMRNLTTQYASLKSTNQVDFDFPYDGGSNASILLRKKGNQLDVIFNISKGQFKCGFDECEASIKWGDEPITTIKLVPPDTHSSEHLFIKNDATVKKFIEKLKTNEKLIVELKFYNEGSRQFTFAPKGLKWS